MTGRERIKAALAHKEAEVPLDIGGSVVTGIASCTYKKLLELLGISDQVLIRNTFSQTSEISEEVFNVLGVDTRPTDVHEPDKFKINLRTENGYHQYTDEWGIVYSMPVDGKSGFSLNQSPLAMANEIKDIDNYNWPDGSDKSRGFGLMDQALNLAEEKKVGVILETDIGGAFEWSCALRGTENFLYDLAADTIFAEALIEKVTDYKIKFWENILSQAGGHVDIVRESDDLAGQRGLLISAEMYKKYIKPAHRRIFDTIRKHTDAAICLHSCGSVRDIIPDFLDIGVTVLNPVQIGAVGMAPEYLKNEFGNDLVFWGGACDSQKEFPNMLPGQVKDAVRKNIDAFSHGGGYICAPINMIQNDVPAENILAFAEAVKEYI